MNRADRLRLSLLVSLGLPAACGGTVLRSHDDPDTGSGGSGATSAGPNAGGASARAGSSSKGGTTGKGGATTFGGKNFGGMIAIGGEGGQPTRCSSPKLDPQTGLVSCSEGYRHRAVAVACGDATGQAGEPAVGGQGGEAKPRVPPGAYTFECDNGEGGAGATPDPRCSTFEHGYCETYDFDGGWAGEPSFTGYCRSGCVIDADCGPGFICLCDEPDSPTGGACRPSNCRTDRNCNDGYLCASYSGSCSADGYACQQPTDNCLVDADCLGGTCEWDASLNKRSCTGCIAGRPFLVAAEARFAPVAARSDWSGSSALPRVDHLTPRERSERAAHWTKLGQMEHASIAAFARFSLQLLSLGAPAELVEATTQALADETAHAKLCFSIASAYAGCAIGPGPLDVSRSLEVTSLGQIVDLVIVEGCFGETSAVLEALEGADAASDPVIRAAYTQIAADEQRHAELAFGFVRWALERDRATVSACIASALSAQPSVAAARLVVAPCLQALVA
jgi:hypothetical protein